MEPQTFCGHNFDFLGSRDVIGHVTIRLPMWGFYRWSMVSMRLSCTVSDIYRLKDIGVTTSTFFGLRDVIGHVTVGSGICGFLLVVHRNHASILHRYGDMKPQTFWGHDFDLLGSRGVIGHVSFDSPCGSGQW